MLICVEGCAHGDLDVIYEEIREYELQMEKKVDLLICCGDFQATRNKEDLACMAVPKKYLEMGGFYKYFTGIEVAPVLTIFIGGNHEASNHLQELSYGGWVAPNIYYLGYANVININGLRIAGVSGIYRNYLYRKGHFECPPYDDSTLRSVYAMRNFEVFRLHQLKPSTIDIMLSHDWPQGIWDHGDRTKRFGFVEGLLKLKPDFKADMDSGKLGNPPCWDLLMKLKPKYWYSAHMHCRFEAKVIHDEEEGKATDFVALDKCILGRHFLEFLTIGDEVERNEDGTAKLTMAFDAEWLAILSLTNKFLNCTSSDTRLPYEPEPNQSNDNEQRWDFSPTEDEIEAVVKKFNNDLTIKHNFKQTVNGYDPEWDGSNFNNLKMPTPVLNIQTTEFCERLGIDDPLLIASNFNNVKVHVPNYTISDQEAFKDCNIVSEKQAPTKKPQLSLPTPINNDEIDLDDLDDDAEENDELKSTKSPEIKAEENIEVKSELDIDTNNVVEIKPEEEEVQQPAVKKFKRRNQEIYTETDE